MIALIACPRWLIELGIAPPDTCPAVQRRTTAYLNKVQVRACAIVPCMLYYLDRGGWELGRWNPGKLGYNKDPAKLQLIMKGVYRQGVQKIKVDGVQVPCSSTRLSTERTRMIVQRVELLPRRREDRQARLRSSQPAPQKMSANVDVNQSLRQPTAGAHATAASPTSNGSEAATAAMPDAAPSAAILSAQSTCPLFIVACRLFVRVRRVGLRCTCPRTRCGKGCWWEGATYVKCVRAVSLHIHQNYVCHILAELSARRVRYEHR